MLETHTLALAQARSLERRHVDPVPAPRAPGWYARLRAAYAHIVSREHARESCC